MPPEITIDQLMRKHAEVMAKAASLVSEKDVDRIQQVTQELEQDGRDLDQLAREFERQELAKAGPPPKGSIEVQLTPGQKERVQKLTGVTLESIVIKDEMGVLVKAMPTTDPRDIEILAINEARRRKALTDADGKMRGEVDRVLAEIEAQGSGEVLEMLDKLKRDPNFLGGMLAKDKK
jgi:hypothetical protein